VYSSVKILLGKNFETIQLPVRSKAYICGRSSTEIEVSNSTGGMDVFLLWLFRFVRERSLRRADHPSRGVLPTVMRLCVWSRNLVNEEALAQWGLSRQKQVNTQYLFITYIYRASPAHFRVPYTIMRTLPRCLKPHSVSQVISKGCW
jgi:hypothetical protein